MTKLREIKDRIFCFIMLLFSEIKYHKLLSVDDGYAIWISEEFEGHPELNESFWIICKNPTQINLKWQFAKRVAMLANGKQ